MPARVHAVVVARSDGEQPPTALRHTLTQLAGQTHPVSASTLIVLGDAGEPFEMLREEFALGSVIAVSRQASYGAAVMHALSGRDLDEEAIWLLAQDTAPAADALLLLATALEQPSVMLAGPKLVAWDAPEEIVSLGVSMTRYGRSVNLVGGELDQGQHDLDRDVLSVDIRGALVRSDAWQTLGGLDPVLRNFDEGLDLGVRARLAGGRVATVPGARVAVGGDAIAGPALRDYQRSTVSDAARARGAQLHRRLAYAPALALAPHWLSLLPLAVARSAGHVLQKRPEQVGSEIGAAAMSAVRVRTVAAARRRISEASAEPRRAAWSRIERLRVTPAELKRSLAGSAAEDGNAFSATPRSELGFFSKGGAWAVLAAAALGLAVFFGYLAWPALSGGGLLPLTDSLESLWQNALFGRRAVGWDLVGPADPFAAVLAVLGTLTWWNPSQSLVLLWLAALPLAMLGGWFAAARLTDRSGLRILAGTVWMLAPPLLMALVEGRPAAVIAHLVLPWFVVTLLDAKQSWAASGAAALLGMVLVAAAPSLAPAVVIIWLVTLVAARARFARVAWIALPAAALFAPLVWSRVVRGRDPITLLADPGSIFPAAGFPDGRLSSVALMAGFPEPTLASWTTFVGDDLLQAVRWIPLALLVPLVVIAGLSLLTGRLVIAAAALGIGLLGAVTALVSHGVRIQFAEAEAVSLWPGNGASLVYLGLAAAAVIALDARVRPAVRALPAVAAIVVGLCAVALATPALTAPMRGESAVTRGSGSTLPAYVEAVGRADEHTGTLKLSILSDGVLVAEVIWGSSSTLDAQTTLLSAPIRNNPPNAALTETVAELTSSASPETAAALSQHGIGFVLLEAGPAGAGSTFFRAAQASIDADPGLAAVGETGFGQLWRLQEEPTVSDFDVRGRTAFGIAVIQVFVVLFAAMMAVPTPESLRQARRRPRRLGAAPPASQRGPEPAPRKPVETEGSDRS